MRQSRTPWAHAPRLVPFRGALAAALGASLVLGACAEDDDDAGSTLPLDRSEYHHTACDSLDRRVVPITTDMDTDAVLTAFVDAQAGDILQFEAGTWTFTRELTLDAPCVVLKGAGAGVTILDWEGTTSGKGIFASGSADHFTAEDFSILNTFDNGIEIRGTTGIILRRLHVEWTGGADTNNGRYAVYPVECQDLLMEHNVARRAADAGIYVGQCHNAVIRWNLAEENVSGIQVENTLGADVYENLSYNNTLGFLIHDLPGLGTTNGERARIYRNGVIRNNFRNFSRESDLTENIPSGTGLIVLGRDLVDIFDNEFEENNTLNIGVVSYLLLNRGEPISDANFDPWPQRVHIHNNTFNGGGSAPESGVEARPLGTFLGLIRSGQPESRIPDIVYDGLLPDGNTEENPFEICVGDDFQAPFLNLHMDIDALAADDIGALQENLDNEIAPFRCSLPAIESTEMLSRVGPGQGSRPSIPN